MQLTLPQQDIYFEQLLFPNEAIYNIGAKIEIKGPIDYAIFQQAYSRLIDDHDAYRMILQKTADGVTTTFVDQHQTRLQFVDFSEAEAPERSANEYMQDEFVRPFDLFANKLLHRFVLLKVEETFHYLFSVYHHIITDGWGTSLMFQRLVSHYNEIVESGTVQSTYPFSYQKFITDDLAYRASDDFEKDKNYWLQRFAQLPENLLDKRIATLTLNKSQRAVLYLKRHRYNQLNDLAREMRVSTFHLILAVLYLYFAKRQHNNDFAIGLPVLNRGKRSFKKTVGLFMGLAPLRIQLDMDSTFRDLVLNVKQQLRQDYRHQRYPLGKLIQELQIFKEKERLFNLTLSYEKQDYSHHFHQTNTRVIPLSHQAERVALAIYIREFDEQEDVKMDFDYNLNYFDESTIEDVVKHFDQLLMACTKAPDCSLKSYVFLGEAEQQKLLIDFNQTKTNFGAYTNFLELFRQQAIQSPHQIACRDRVRAYSYADLDRLSDQMARYLQSSLALAVPSPIAVLMDRSANLLAVLLGIMKSGNAYIPLDPSFPVERLNYILKHSQSKCLISDGQDVELLEDLNEVKVVKLDQLLLQCQQLAGQITAVLSAKTTAYIIYTSGSTGKPKGVEIAHAALLNFLLSMREKPGVRAEDLLFSVTTYSFDISILEFFTPLISGATVYMVDPKTLANPKSVIQLLQEVRPTILQATPSFYQMLYHAGWEGMRELKLLCGGDLLSEALAARLLEDHEDLWNMYGPTETTIWSSIKKLNDAREASNIGRPIHNTSFYILNENLQVMPLGARGAIYIGGSGLAKGYFRNPQLSQERFIDHPFEMNQRIYKTGDVGRWNDAGEIEFLGRDDLQVKIRGYRIELGEIETQLHQLTGIQSAIVVAKKGTEQDAYLVAYVLLKEDALSTTEIIQQLSLQLPPYMIPQVIEVLDHFPLTPNQKVDRKSLIHKSLSEKESDSILEKPQTELEKELLVLWKIALDRCQTIGLTDHFFRLGGHSLKAVRLTSLINERLNLPCTLKTIFDYPTIASLAKYLESKEPSREIHIPPAPRKDFYAITDAQHSIWLTGQGTRQTKAYHMPAAFRINGFLDVHKIDRAMNQLIDEYEILRTNFVEIEGEVLQKIHPRGTHLFKTSIATAIPEQLDLAIQEFVNLPFSLEEDVLIRIKIIPLGEETSLLLCCTHHVIMDGWSLEVLMNKLIQYYPHEDARTYKTVLPIQFKDYSEWLNQECGAQQMKNEVFWKNYLKHYSPKESFATDYTSDHDQNRLAQYSFEWSAKMSKGIQQLVETQQTTIYTFLMTVLNALIWKQSMHQDIVVGTIYSGREQSVLADQIGMFAKTLLLRTKLQARLNFNDLLISTQNNLLKIYAHQDTAFAQLGQSNFDVLLVLQNPDFSINKMVQTLGAYQFEPMPVNAEESRLPLTFNFFTDEQGLSGIVDYDAARFSSETIQIILLKMKQLVEAVLQNPLIEIEAIDLELSFEKQENIAIDFEF